LTITFASATDVGKLRDHNEDAVGDPELWTGRVAPDAIDVHGHLFAVADGMGGHENGEVASAMAMSALFRTYYRSENDPPTALVAAFKAANDAVRTASVRNASDNASHALPMGTTLVAAALVGSRALLANVGDSRGYLLRGGDLSQITDDHSLVAQLVRQRVLTSSEAMHARYRNVLMRAVGLSPEVDPDIFEIDTRPGDLMLLSSDGLHGVVGEDSIGDILKSENDLQRAAQRLIDRANALGGPDNISVIVVRIGDHPKTSR